MILYSAIKTPLLTIYKGVFYVHIKITHPSRSRYLSAIALVFDKIPLFTMPQGGSVSLVMLPILLLALRHGLGVGFLLVVLSEPFNFSTVATSKHFQVFLDYAFSYAGIGLAGLVAPTLSKQKI